MFKQNRVIDHRAAVIAQWYIFPLANIALRKIARTKYLNETRRVRSADLHLTFNAHVPLGNTVDQCPYVLQVGLASNNSLRDNDLVFVMHRLGIFSAF